MKSKILNGERISSLINGVGKLDNHMQMKLYLYLTPLTKIIGIKWIKDLYKTQAIKLLEENRGN